MVSLWFPFARSVHQLWHKTVTAVLGTWRDATPDLHAGQTGGLVPAGWKLEIALARWVCLTGVKRPRVRKTSPTAPCVGATPTLHFPSAVEHGTNAHGNLIVATDHDALLKIVKKNKSKKKQRTRVSIHSPCTDLVLTSLGIPSSLYRLAERCVGRCPELIEPSRYSS